MFLSAMAAVVSLMNVRWGLFFLGEPLVTGFLVGLALRDVSTGLFLGGIIQFMWINSVPVGVKVQSNFTVMTLLSVMLVERYGQQAFPFAFALGYFFAMLSRHFEVLTRKFNNSLADTIQRKLETVGLTRIHLIYMAVYTALLACLIYASIVFSHYILFRGLPYVPLTVLAAFSSAWDYLPLYGLSLFFNAVTLPFKVLYLAAGVATGIVTVFFRSETRLALYLLAAVSFILPVLEGRIPLLRRRTGDA
jgi:mannose/fructose/N-acetylgalactosamine-specific phosphotransferase system component IIC